MKKKKLTSELLQHLLRLVQGSVQLRGGPPAVPLERVRGQRPQVADLARHYRIAYQIEKPKPGDSADTYNVTHSRGVFVFDNRGKARLLASDTEAVDAVTADLRKLIGSTRKPG